MTWNARDADALLTDGTSASYRMLTSRICAVGVYEIRSDESVLNFAARTHRLLDADKKQSELPSCTGHARPWTQLQCRRMGEIYLYFTKSMVVIEQSR